ncbi:MAG: ABC transporter permease, partial [Clostridiales bacterium]|nr:ABC transporter permease [Clostridiales bacterium]
MRLMLTIKIMLRSPLKTLLTFALLIAASFMLVYSAADYALTAREYRRAYGRYRGIGSVEYGPGESIFGPFYPYFLLTDPRSPVSPERIKDYDKPINEKWLEEKYHYERFHQKSISASVMDEMASLPYVTSMGRRYMTAGVSEDYYRMENYEEHFNYPGRFVFEATLNELYKSSPDASSGGWPNQPVRVLLLEDIEMLAGNTEWLEIPELPKYGDMRRVAIGTFDLPIPEYLDSAYYCTDISRVVVVSRFNRCYMEQLESMVPGNRYVFVGRVEPYSWIGFEHFCIGDDMLYNWWPYIYPIPLDTGIAELPENYLELDECAPLRELIQITNDDLHTFDVVYTDDMGAIRRVTEEKILVTEGRLLTPEDSRNGNRVCVISDAFMKANDLSLGDKLSLRLGNELFEQYVPLGAVASARERYADTFVEEEFEIVGAYVDINAWKMRDADLYWAYSDSTVFVPLSFLPLSESELEGHEFKPGEISFVVGEAKNIRAFTEECIPKLEEMGLTIFFTDGGWLGIEEKFIR